MLHLTLLLKLTHYGVISVSAATQAAGVGGSGLHCLVHLPLPALQGALSLAIVGRWGAAVDVRWLSDDTVLLSCLPGQPAPACPAVLDVKSLPTAGAPVMQSSRQELLQDVEELKKKVTGAADE